MANYDPYGQEILGLERQREFARKLREQADQPLQGQMVSGYYVSPSWTQYAANALRGYLAGKQEQNYDKQIKQVGERQQQETAADMQKMTELLRGTPEKQVPFENPNMLPEEQPIPGLQTTIPAKPGDLGAALIASNYKTPQMQQMAAQKALEQSMAQFEPTKPMAVGKSLVDPRTGKVIYKEEEAPEKPKIAALPEYYDIGPDGKPVVNQERYNLFLQGRKAGATNVTQIGKTESKYGETLATKVAEKDIAMRDLALEAPSKLQTIAETKKILANGNVFTGMGANQKLDWARLGQAFGVTGKNTNEVVENTQRLMANRAQATLDAIKGSGLGSGQGFTDKDRQFLENARLGNITYSPAALQQQLDIEEKVARGAVKAWNSRKANMPKSAVQTLGIENEEITLPPPAPVAPAGARRVPPPPAGFRPL